MEILLVIFCSSALLENKSLNPPSFENTTTLSKLILMNNNSPMDICLCQTFSFEIISLENVKHTEKRRTTSGRTDCYNPTAMVVPNYGLTNKGAIVGHV